MFSSRFKIILRSLWKNKGTSFINLFGLTIGLSSCLLIFLYIGYQFSYDNFQEKGDRIARVIMEYRFDGSPNTTKGNFTSTKVAPVFPRLFPEVLKGVRLNDAERVLLLNNQPVKESNFLYADSTFFDLFHYELLQGNPAKLLNGPHQLVLTETSARKYFGQESPLGKLILPAGEGKPFEVTGVVRDYPANSQIRFDFLASFSTLGANQEETYFEANYTTYLLLQSPDALNTLPEKVAPYMKKEMAGSGATINFSFEPFNEIHLHSPYTDMVPNASMDYLYILAAVAFLILLIVSFTYINVNTARSIERAREVGVRKVVGSSRQQIFWQFIGESFFLCAASVIISFQVAALALPWFNQLTEEQLSVDALWSWPVIAFAVMLTAIVSLLAGAYPAAVLSDFQPARVLKGVFRNSRSGKRMQQSLIVFQFAISVFLMVCTFFIQKQLSFIQNKKLGFDREHIIVLPLSEKTKASLASFKTELKNIPGVLHASRCVNTPVRIGGGYNMRSAAMPENEQMAVTANPVDEEYLSVTGLQLIAGQNFTEQDLVDINLETERQEHFILNESAAAQLGWSPEEAVGKAMFLGDGRPGTVRGVVKDFHFESLHTPIKPLVLFTETWGRRLLVKIDGKDITQTLTGIQSFWSKHVDDIPFEYHFLDDDYNKMYNSEIKLGNVMNLFASIAILLACLGLFGLSTLVVQQRIKEVSIRKVLGANVMHLVAILSGGFTRLVVIAILIAAPLAWYAMTMWLQDFAYAIPLDAWVFGVVGLAAILIAFITVSVQGLQAAMTNPAETLKSE